MGAGGGVRQSCRRSPRRPGPASTWRPRASRSSYLVSQQSRNTCFRGVTNGREVMAALQGQNNPAACQAHQLLRQVPETCNETRGCECRAGRAWGSWQAIKAPRNAAITSQGAGWRTRPITEARLGGSNSRRVSGWGLFDLCESRNYGFSVFIL